ncbi:MAG: hypothetical protein ACI4S3_03045 [Candidatus Gastranaerophilaceae bacterium]
MNNNIFLRASLVSNNGKFSYSQAGKISVISELNNALTFVVEIPLG